MPWLIWALILIGAGAANILSMNNVFAALAMIAGTWLAAFLSKVCMYEVCMNEGPDFTVFKLWLHKDGIQFSFIASIIAVGCTALIAFSIAEFGDYTVYWRGLFIPGILLFVVVLVSGFFGVRECYLPRIKS